MPTPAGRERIRPPMQVRSRETWERVLEAGTAILTAHGREGLTIAAVCERAEVAPTVIYRRVDGLAGLFHAIYDRGMVDVVASYRDGLTAAAQLPEGSLERVRRVVRAVGDTWELNAAFLHPIVIETSDKALIVRGAAESRELVELVTELLPHPDPVVNHDVARLLHQECILRCMYGNNWITDEPESYAAFLARLGRITERLVFPD